MKTSALGLSLLTLLSTAYGQEPSPREQFQAAVAAYQKEKGATQENALKVIALFKQLDPPPAVPEEARKPFVMGATMLQESKDAAGAAKAVEQFGKALQIAPWFAEAWYNRALARETAGQFGAAIDDLKMYLEFKLADAERREAKDKTYALEAKAEIAAAKKAGEQTATKEADTPQAREAALLKKVEGARFVDRKTFPGSDPASWDYIYEIKDGTLLISLQIHSLGSGAERVLGVDGYNRPGLYPLDRGLFRDGAFLVTKVVDSKTYKNVYRIGLDGEALVLQPPVGTSFSETVIPRKK